MPNTYRLRKLRKSRPRRKGALAVKNIKRRTGPKAQSRQILSLTRRVRQLTRATWIPYKLQWNRPRMSFCFGFDPNDSTKTPAANCPYVYVCPLPVAPSVQLPNAQYGNNNPRGSWSDNGCGANVQGGLNCWNF